MCVYTHSASDKARTYIVKGFLKENSYMLLIEKLNVYLFNLVVLFHAKKKKENKKEKKNRISCTLCV